MDILIVKPYWTDRILAFDKRWEIRGSNTSKRGRIALAKSGTGHVFGTANLIGSIPLSKELWESNRTLHQVNISWEELLEIYKHPHAWIFEKGSAVKYPVPIPYSHPKGAVIWVKENSINLTSISLSEEVE